MAEAGVPGGGGSLRVNRGTPRQAATRTEQISRAISGLTADVPTACSRAASAHSGWHHVLAVHLAGGHAARQPRGLSRGQRISPATKRKTRTPVIMVRVFRWSWEGPGHRPFPRRC
jgi:hypothetical protein